MIVMCGVLMRVMVRTREVEVDKEEIDNLDQLDQTRHASSTLGECETLLARSFISPGPLCPTLSQSQASSLPHSLESSITSCVSTS